MSRRFSVGKSTEKATVTPKQSRHFKPNKLAFNFSFITQDRKYDFDSRGFNKTVQKKFVERLVALSQENFDIVLGLPKESGLEKLSEKQVHFRLNSDFVKSGRHQDCLDGFWIFRLNKLGRVIGKTFEKTFYILCIDTTFDTYSHGS